MLYLSLLLKSPQKAQQGNLQFIQAEFTEIAQQGKTLP